MEGTRGGVNKLFRDFLDIHPANFCVLLWLAIF